MSDIAIRCERLSKQYRIGKRERYRTLRDVLSESLSAPFRLARNSIRHPQSDTFWALDDISFEIKRGEVVGIIGRNGAGKSTLLKILSRITEPTRGYADIYGRVGSLLEVGTGFNPELTGCENIYLNGAILGMKKAEIERKYDDVVDFAEIGKFIDTPVKHYSSGMYTRLAFSVAAHLEPEIMLVDEVLAVGDAAFQKKCLGRMGNVAKEGRTVLFVSHNLGAIVSLCSRCIMIEKGNIIQDGPASQVASVYQSGLYSTVANAADLSNVARYGTGKAKFTSINVTSVDSDGASYPFLQTGQSLRVDLRIAAIADIVDANVAVIIYDSSGYRIIDVNTALHGNSLTLRCGQEAHIQFKLHELLLKPSNYLLGLWLGRGGIEELDGITYAISFSVEPDPEALLHSETFPGIYQCRFTHSIKITTLTGH
jgi:lipopolysaccharide transport system ATP-binding protein